MIEDALDLTRRIKLVTGIRFENFYLDRMNYSASGVFQGTTSFEKTYHPLNYRAGLVYNIVSYLTAYGQYSTGQDPIGDDIFLVNAGTEKFNLASSQQGEVGFKSIFPHQWGEATIAAYYINRKNILAPVPGHPDEVENIGDQQAHGLEFSLLLNPIRNFTVNFNYAYTHSRFGNFQDLATGNNYFGTEPADVPTNTANLWLRLVQVAHTPLELGGGIHFVGDRYADNGNLTKLLSYATLDVYGTYHFNEKYSLTGRGRNLTNKVYAQWADIYYPPEILLGAPRSGEVEFRLRF